MTTRATSHQAYEYMKSTGRIGQKQQEVYETLARRGPSTANEVWEAIRQNHGEIRYDSNTRARFTELRGMGLIREKGQRKCTVTGRACIEWEVADDAKVPEVTEKKRPSPKAMEDVLRRIVNEIPWPIEGIRKNGHPHLADALEEAKALLGEA